MLARRQTGARTELYRYAGVGLQFAATIGVFAFLGYWVDDRLGSGPWLLIAGVFLGFGLGLVSMISKLSPPRAPRRDDAPSDPSRHDSR